MISIKIALVAAEIVLVAVAAVLAAGTWVGLDAKRDVQRRVLNQGAAFRTKRSAFLSLS